MKVKNDIINKVILLILLIGITDYSFSQCNNGSQYGGTLAPTGGGTNLISSCNYATEYAPVTGVAAASNYQITSSIATDFITVRQGTSGGPVVAFGVQPLNWTSTVAGTYYIHFNTNSACGTQSSCRSTNITHVQSTPDTPCDAWVLTIGCGAVTTGNNVGMTDSGISAPSCGAYSGGDTWYSIVVPASGAVGFECFAGTLTDVSMAIYSASGGCAGTLTELSCNDNSGTGNMPLINSTTLAPGSTIYVRVWDNNNDQTGDYTIRVVDLSDLFCYTGNAVSTGSGCAQLTAASNDQNGSIWDANDVLDFTTDWSYDFKVNLGSSDGGADGVCFVIQNDPAGLLASGTSGGSMGAGGITNSLIVEVDTYINSEDRNDGLPSLNCSSGPDWDHIDIWENGNINPGTCSSGARVVPNAVELLSGGSLYNIENGLDHTLRISYVSATQTFTVTVLDDAAVVTYGTISHSPIDPMVVFGTNTPYFGFTASTGGLNNVQTGCLAPEFMSLPITLVNFDVNCTEGMVQLDWTTASEINNDYFTVERSDDGISFEVLATIGGAGNNNSELVYTWVDDSPLSKVGYYRLKQTDFNGKYTYFEMIASQCGSNEEIGLYPNPTKSYFSFNYNSVGENLLIEVRNMAGQLVVEKKYTDLPIGKSLNKVGIEGLGDGVYYVTFTSVDQRVTHKLSVVN